MNGFKLNSLTSTGEIVPASSVQFKSGLNLIVGPSDTGKTYIFGAIDYMLGGGNIPKEITQAKNYLTMYLEIEILETKAIYTISRSLLNAKENIIIYHSAFFDIDSAKTTILHYEGSKTKENISTFLLNKCGFEPPIQIRTNTNYEKENFTFRGYIPYSMVSETKMIAENSPIYNTNSFTEKTKYLYQFKYLITNNDDSDIEKALKPTIFSATKNASIDLLNELLDQEKEKNDELIEVLNLNREKYSGINVTTSLLKNIQEEISFLNNEIQKLNTSRNKVEADINYNKSVLRRFKLLRKQYISDIERLQFIDEGSFLINQLVAYKCPHCGKNIDSFHDCSDFDLDLINESCEYEIIQNRLKLNELDSSISTTTLLINDLNEKFVMIEGDLKLNTERLTNTLNPELSELNKKLKNFSDLEIIKTKLKQNEKKISEYEYLIEEFKEKKLLKYGKPNQMALDVINSTDFAEELTKVLKSFYYDENKKIKLSFDLNDLKEVDFSINNEQRITLGKGSRALFASSFFIAIRNYCNKKKYPHGNFLILDSPINAFKEEQGMETIKSSTKNKFLEYLASNAINTQTIVMENLYLSDIENNLKKKIHIIEFTKSDEGRYGFYLSE